jgi:putative ABC transport system substrate-binding protein
MTTRRQVVLLLTGAVLLRSEAHAQAKAVRVTWLSSDRAGGDPAFFDSFRDGLRNVGYVEGRNLAIDARWGENSPERLAVPQALLLRADRIIE